MLPASFNIHIAIFKHVKMVAADGIPGPGTVII